MTFITRLVFLPLLLRIFDDFALTLHVMFIVMTPLSLDELMDISFPGLEINDNVQRERERESNPLFSGRFWVISFSFFP